MRRTAEARRTIIIDDYLHSAAPTPDIARAGVRAGIGVPVVVEGRLLGVMVVGSTRPGRRFTHEDTEGLELLAESAAAELIGLERARLEAVRLTARTASHHLGNELALTLGYSELLATSPDLPERLRAMAEEALLGAQRAGQTLAKLQRVVRLEEAPSGRGHTQPLLDLDRSSG